MQVDKNRQNVLQWHWSEAESVIAAGHKIYKAFSCVTVTLQEVVE